MLCVPAIAIAKQRRGGHNGIEAAVRPRIETGPGCRRGSGNAWPVHWGGPCMAGFDPYRKWLGIPPNEQPPNHYRLLGIGLFESDPDVIPNASDRQMFHVRTFQSGGYAEIAQFILNELSAARVCLLDPQRKAEYDHWLRQTLPSDRSMPMPPGGVAGSESPAWSWSAGTRPARFRRAGPRRRSVGILIPVRRLPPVRRQVRRPRRRPARAVGQSGVRIGRSPRWAASPGRAHRGAAPRRTKRRPLGHRVGPDSPPRSPPQKKGSPELMGLGIALAALSFLVALGFLFAFLTHQSPGPAERSPDAPAAEQPLFGPAVPVIYKHVPAKPKEGRDERTRRGSRVRTGRQTCSVVAGAAAQGPSRGGFPGHSRQSGHDPDGAVAPRTT